MPDVFERVSAMPTVVRLLPDQPSVGSELAEDGQQTAFSIYAVARLLLVDAVYKLQLAANLAQQGVFSATGTHILFLRPCLISVAKVAWIIRPDHPRLVASRAALLVAEDQRQGANAMTKAVKQGGPAGFGVVASNFEQTRRKLLEQALHADPDSPGRLPREEELILQLGDEVDGYYGTTDSRLDVQLLWSSASGLAHGERWFAALAGAQHREQVADTLTRRSFDAVSSAMNVTTLRLLTRVSEHVARHPAGPVPEGAQQLVSETCAESETGGGGGVENSCNELG